MSLRIAFVALVAVAVLSLVPALRAQQTAPPLFRSEVEAVEVDVFVNDRAGNPVSELRASDFELYEDNKPQTITSFSEVNIPLERPEPLSANALAPDVATNGNTEGRLYVIAFDEVSTDLALRTRQFLRRFIEEHFGPNDVAAVVYVGRGSSKNAQDFTSNRQLLLKAIDAFSGGFPEIAGGTGDARADAFYRASQVRSQARAMRDLMEALAKIQGRRKAMIYVSQKVGESAGIPSDISEATLAGADVFDVLDYRGGVRSIQFDDLRAAMTSAMRGGVAIYAIDPAGLTPGGTLGESEAAQTTDASAELERVGQLRMLSEATGGFALVNSNNVDAAFTRLVRENSTYYELGFTSTNTARDGRYRRLSVRMKNPSLSARTRDGYIAPSKTPAKLAAAARPSVLSEGVRESLGSPISSASVAMAAFATAYRSPKNKAATVLLSVTMDATQLGLVDRGPAMVGDVEVAWVAVNKNNKVTGQHEVVGLVLRPERYAAAKANGVRVLSAMTLAPGKYQLRVAGGNTQNPKAGSVLYDLDVPDFGSSALTMSAPSLATTAHEPVTAVPKTAANIVPAPPTTERQFASGAPVSMYVETYSNNHDISDVALTLDVRDESGRIMKTATEHRASAASATQRFTLPVPLDLPPGRYVLHVEARATPGKQPPLSRDVPIKVK